MRRELKAVGLYVAGHVQFALAVLGLVVVGAMTCTPKQRTIARTVIDVVEAVCLDSPTLRDCLARTHLAMSAQPGFDTPDAGGIVDPFPSASSSASAVPTTPVRPPAPAGSP